MIEWAARTETWTLTPSSIPRNTEGNWKRQASGATVEVQVPTLFQKTSSSGVGFARRIFLSFPWIPGVYTAP